MTRLAPLHRLLLYYYRWVTDAFESHEANALDLLADASNKTGLLKAGLGSEAADRSLPNGD